MPQPVGNQIWNVPNVLSMIRLVMSCVVFALIPLQCYLAAFWLFVIAAGTDWIDGWWARRFNQVTQFGRILDPFCDKILICGIFILVAVEMRDRIEPWYATVTGWMAVIVIARELLVTALRSFIEQSGGDFSAKLAGKLKMWFQCFAAGGALIALSYWKSAPGQALPGWLTWFNIIFIWAAVLSTLQSGIDYVRIALKRLLSAASS
jgi:CDP-diacylglycerol--glycerol-3-phosphate 3-phosphatidyltransferase